MGDIICTNGANSGTHCGLTIQKTDISFVGPNGIARKFADYATNDTVDDVGVANGDSGGPVYAFDSHGNRWARGTISSLDTKVDCFGMTTTVADSVMGSGTHRSPECYNGVYYVPIYQILYDKGWTINTP